jgi:hypothetical protein
MDIAAGDFPDINGGNIAGQTFTVFENMMRRILNSGQGGNLGDFQFFVTDSGNLRVIDAGNFAVGPNSIATTTRQFRSDVMSHRLNLIIYADPSVGRAYSEQLRNSDQRASIATMDRIAMWDHDRLRHLYITYEELLRQAGSS